MVRRALEVPGAPPTAQMTARSALGFGLMLTGQGDEAIDSLAFLSTSAIEPEPLDAELLASRASFKAWWGDVTGAHEDASAVVGWSRAGMPVRSLPNAYGALAETEFHLGRWDDGLAHIEIAISVSEDSGRAWDRSYVYRWPRTWSRRAGTSTLRLTTSRRPPRGRGGADSEMYLLRLRGRRLLGLDPRRLGGGAARARSAE